MLQRINIKCHRTLPSFVTFQSYEYNARHVSPRKPCHKHSQLDLLSSVSLDPSSTCCSVLIPSHALCHFLDLDRSNVLITQPAFFFLSSTHSTLSSGICLYVVVKKSNSSSLTSPCTVISSPPPGIFVTLLPVANFLPKSLAHFLSSSPNASSPVTVVTYLRLLRSIRLMVIVEVASFSDSRADAASALAAFFAASFVARSCAETDRADKFCVNEESKGELC
jgi:hypothetical protein